MSRYEKIPKLEIDWNKSQQDIIKQLIDQRFILRGVTVDEIFRAELLKMSAIIGWSLLAILSSLLILISQVAS